MNTEETKQSTSACDKDRKIGTAEHIPSITTESQSDRIFKPLAKAWEGKTLTHQNQLSSMEQNSEIEKPKTLFSIEQSSEIEKPKALPSTKRSLEIKK